MKEVTSCLINIEKYVQYVGKRILLNSCSDHLRQVHQLSVEDRQPYLRSVMYCNTMATESFPQHHLEICPYPNFQLEHMFNLIVVGPTKSGKTHFEKQILTKKCIRYPNPGKPRQI